MIDGTYREALVTRDVDGRPVVLWHLENAAGWCRVLADVGEKGLIPVNLTVRLAGWKAWDFCRIVWTGQSLLVTSGPYAPDLVCLMAYAVITTTFPHVFGDK